MVDEGPFTTAQQIGLVGGALVQLGKKKADGTASKSVVVPTLSAIIAELREIRARVKAE
jgi:hypothetical protein